MLDAPELQDDFYLNLVDWSAQNVLAVGLGSCVYLWSACTSQVSSTAKFNFISIFIYQFLFSNISNAFFCPLTYAVELSNQLYIYVTFYR